MRRRCGAASAPSLERTWHCRGQALQAWQNDACAVYQARRRRGRARRARRHCARSRLRAATPIKPSRRPRRRSRSPSRSARSAASWRCATRWASCNGKRPEYSRALRHYELALASCAMLGDRVHEGLMLNSLGVTLSRLQSARGSAHGARGERRAEPRDGRTLLEAMPSRRSATFTGCASAPTAARECFEQSLALRRALSDVAGEAQLLQRLAQLVHGTRSNRPMPRYIIERSVARRSRERARSRGTPLGRRAQGHAGRALDPQLCLRCRRQDLLRVRRAERRSHSRACPPRGTARDRITEIALRSIPRCSAEVVG